MMKLLPLAFVLALAACGADGPPEAPSRAPELQDGLLLSGDARLGVAAEF